MSLAASLNKYKSEIADAASRNAQHARPSSAAPARTSTPKSASNTKRPHDAAFPPTAAPTTAKPSTGSELMTQVWQAIEYLKEKNFRAVPVDDVINYLSLPIDLHKNIPHIKTALRTHHRAEFIPKAESGTGKDMIKYRPLHPVTNAEELKDYLARQPTAQGLSVAELKEGWPDCIPTIDRLESTGCILVMRNKKDDSPKMVWTDSPTYHILNHTSQLPQKVDPDFIDFWSKTKLPASEAEIRTELEKAGLTPTSQVKEMKRVDTRRKEKRKVNRRGGKTTNTHMTGILKEFTR